MASRTINWDREKLYDLIWAKPMRSRVTPSGYPAGLPHHRAEVQAQASSPGSTRGRMLSSPVSK